MIDFLIVFGILAIVSVAEFLIFEFYEWFEDEGAIGLIGTNVVVITILVAMRVLGK